MMNKQYDWFATRIFQPELSLDELFDQGITPENTGFKTREDYKNNMSVRDQFRTEDGGFDEDSFNRAYDSSREMYNLYVNREYSKKLLEEYAHDPYEWYTPATEEIIDVSASNTPTQNGMFYSTNIAGIGEDTESPYSVREIAQKQLVHDENGNQLDWTPEDKGGLLKGMFRDPLVLATYDEDTPEYDDDGNLLAIHKKGEYKLNEWGAPYYEKLGDRDAYGKEMLHYTDTFTKEGTVLNKFDFYDSDGKRKSVFGTAMRTASQILPMFLPPVVGYTWGALNAAKGIGQSMAALGKGIDSIITGEDDNEFGRALTKMENWLARFDNSKSDYGNEHMWASAETYGDLIGSTTKQLFEQRLIANIPKQLKFLGTDIQRSKMGQNMAIAYMAATSAKESYQAGIEAGLGDRQAGLLLLANTAAMWKLMDSDYGRSTLFKGSWFDDDITKKTAKETADFMVKSTDERFAMKEINEKMAKYGSTKLVKPIENATKDVGKAVKKSVEKQTKEIAKEGGEEAIKKGAQKGVENVAKESDILKDRTLLETSKDFLKKAYNKSIDALKNKLEAFKGVDPEEYLSAMLREGVEEVAEEAISDATKATTLALEALGVKMNDTGEKLDYGFSGKDIFDRYLLSFIGGAVGGGIFRGYSAYEQYRDNDWKRVIPDYQRDLIFMVADGRGEEIINEYKRLYDKGLLGSTELKSNFRMSINDNVDVAEDGELSQADANLKILVGNVRYIEQVLKDEGIFDAIKKSKEAKIVTARNLIWNDKNNHLTEGQKRGAFLMSKLVGAHQLMTHDFIKLGEDFFTARSWWEGVTKDFRNKDGRTDEETKVLNDANRIYENRIKELRQRRDDILDGKYNGDYVSSILLETEGILPKLLSPGIFDKDSWALQTYGRRYDTLNDLYKKQVDKDLETYFNRELNFYGKNFAETHTGTKRAFFELQRLMKPEFEKQNEELKGKRINDFHTNNYFGENYFRSLEQEANLIRARRKVENDKAKLTVQEKTPEIEKQIAELDGALTEIDNKINEVHARREKFSENKQNFIPASMLTQTFKDGDEKLQKLVDSYHSAMQSEIPDDIKNNFPDILTQILGIYKEIKNDNGLVQDFGELKMAEQAIITYTSHLKKNLFVFDPMLQPLLVYDEDLFPIYEGTLLEANREDGHKSEPRAKFRSALDNFIKYVKESKYDKAKAEYDIMKALVLKTLEVVSKPEFISSFESADLGDSMDFTDVEAYLKNCFFVPNLQVGDEVENPFDSFFDIVEVTTKLNKTPFTALLNTFSRKFYEDENIVTTAAYVENFFNEYVAAKNWTDFFIVNPDDQTNLEKLIEAINMMETLLSIDSKTIETMNAFYDDDRKMVVFDPISKRNLLKDLDVLRNKIFVVLKNGLRNSGNRHEGIEKDFRIRTINDVQNLLKFWGGIDKEKRNKNFDVESIWESVVEDSNSLDKDKLKNIKEMNANDVDYEKFVEIYSLIRTFESKLHTAWQVLTKDLSPEKQIDEFFKLFEVDEEYFSEILLNKNRNPYNRQNVGALTPMETFQYLMQIVSVNAISLDQAYKGALSVFAPSESNTPNIPNDEQERAVKMAVSYINNRTFWNNIRSGIINRLKTRSWEGDAKERADMIVAHEVLNNTLVIPGACGVGKTTMVGLVLKNLWGSHRNIIFTAPKPDTADKLAASFGQDPKSKNITINGKDEEGKVVTEDCKEALFKFLFGEKATNKFDYIGDKETGALKIDRSKYDFLELTPTKLNELKQYEIMFIDEIGQYNEIELKLIDEVAEKAGIIIIGLGDHCQIGDIVESTAEDDKEAKSSDNSSYQDVEVWKTPYLIRSMRSTSVSQATNSEKLGRAIYAIEEMFYKSDLEVSNLIRSKTVGGESIETRLTYSSLLKSGFCGNRIETSEKEFNEVVDHVIKTKKPEDVISIVVDSDTKGDEWKEKLKKIGLKENEYIIKNIEKNEINGYETAYAIVDIDWSNRIKGKRAKTAWKEFYTISQRSHYATLFLDKTNSLKDIHITSQYDKDGSRIWINSPDFVRDRYEKRMKLLEAYKPIVLFAPSDRLSYINHSVDDDNDDKKDGEEGSTDIPDIPLPPTFDDSSEEPESTPEPEVDPEVEKEKELNNQRSALEGRIESIFEKLYNEGFLYDKDKGVVESPVLNSVGTLDLDTTNIELNKVNEGLAKISEFLDDLQDIDDAVKSVITDEITNKIDAYNKYLVNAKNLLEIRLSELAKESPLEVARTIVATINEEIDTLITDWVIGDDRSITGEIELDKKLIDKYRSLQWYVSNLSSDIQTILIEDSKLDDDVVKFDTIDEQIKDWEEEIEELKEELLEKHSKFIEKYPVRDSFDDIDNVDPDTLSDSDKDNLSSKIDNVINVYQNMMNSLTEEERNDRDLESILPGTEISWKYRISELQQIKNKLAKAVVPKENSNVEYIRTEAKNLFDDIAAKKIKRDAAIDVAQEIVNFATRILTEDDTLTESDVKKIEKYRSDLQTWINDITYLLPKDEKIETVFENSYTKETTGFTANQTISEKAKLNLAETENILKQERNDLTIDDIVKNKFTKEGKLIYDDLVEQTKNGNVVTVWGLDLETTGSSVANARIVQIGLVQYEISRQDEKWTVKAVKNTGVSEFVSPINETGDSNTDNMTPPEKLNGKENPILSHWKASRKISEKEALERIFNTIKKGSSVVTYNGISYDMNVLKNRATKLGVKTDVLDSWKQIDVLADFTSSGGTDLMWKQGSSGNKETVYLENNKLETFNRVVGRADSQQGYFGSDWQLKVGKSHDAKSDVDATLNVLMNMFNGIPAYKATYSIRPSSYGRKTMHEDIYQRDVLIPFVKNLKNTKYKTSTVEDLFTVFYTLRHRVLRGDIEVNKFWEYDSVTDRSTLYFINDVTGDRIPLLVVTGERKGTYTGTLKFVKTDIGKGAPTDMDLLELRKLDPSIRISKPFVLTGVRYNEVGSLNNLSKEAREFYSPDGESRNLGKTYVLITSDPSFDDDWDPSLALSGSVREDGTIDWIDKGFQMVTVSRTVNLQEIIDFSIASCTLASDHLLGGSYMEDYFKKWKDNKKKSDTIGGITLSQGQYDKLLAGCSSWGEGLQLFHSPVFSVMDSRNVGKFLAGFVNGCAKNSNELNDLLQGEDIKKPLDQWVFNNVIHSLRGSKKMYRKGWNAEKYDEYYTVDISIEGKLFKLVCDGATNNLYLFENTSDLNIDNEISSIGESTKRLLTISSKSSNIVADLYDFFENMFGKNIGQDLFFDSIALMTNKKDDSGWTKTYPVGSNEVFTRAFTTWVSAPDSPRGLRGWDKVFETIQQDITNFTHGIFGHEIIDKSPNATIESSIFSMSICNTALNGEYVARNVNVREYGYWTLNDDDNEVDKFKTKITNKINQLIKLHPVLENSLAVKVDELSQNATNRNLSDDEIDVYLLNEANLLLRGASTDMTTVVYINSSGEFESKTTYKTIEDLPNDLGYDKNYYWLNAERNMKAYMTFENKVPTAFYIEIIGHTQPYIINFKDADYKTSLFKNLLVSLWDKNFKLNGLENYGYLRYFMHQVMASANNTENFVGDVIISAVRDCILAMPLSKKDEIFTQDIQKALLEADSDLQNLCDSGFDFYEALDMSEFDIFSLIKQICN